MTAPARFVVVAYDIADDRRRSRVEKILRGYGLRVNYSVFECRVGLAHLPRLKARIAAEIRPAEDSVLYYELCAACVGRRDTAGLPPPSWQGVVTV